MPRRRASHVLVLLAIAVVCAFLVIRLSHDDTAIQPAPQAGVTVYRDSATNNQAISHSHPSDQTPSGRSILEPTDNVIQPSHSRGIYHQLLDRHRRVRKQQSKFHTWPPPTGFEWDAQRGYLQARLLAIWQPEEIEKETLFILRNPNSVAEDIVFALQVLGVLASENRPGAQAALLDTITTTKDDPAIEAAMAALMKNDKEGRHRDIYWAKCLEKTYSAFEYGPFWVDEQTKRAITQLHRELNTPISNNFYAREAFDRLAILESSSRSLLLNQLVSDSWDFKERSEAATYRENWALRVVQINPTPETLDILRRRLDRGESEAASSSNGPFAPTQIGYQDETRDRLFDECLLVYLSLGGKLNEIETKRLHYYGYLGNPKENLERLLAEEK